MIARFTISLAILISMAGCVGSEEDGPSQGGLSAVQDQKWLVAPELVATWEHDGKRLVFSEGHLVVTPKGGDGMTFLARAADGKLATERENGEVAADGHREAYIGREVPYYLFRDHKLFALKALRREPGTSRFVSTLKDSRGRRVETTIELNEAAKTVSYHRGVGRRIKLDFTGTYVRSDDRLKMDLKLVGDYSPPPQTDMEMRMVDGEALSKSDLVYERK
jgi:hypothetical protein